MKDRIRRRDPKTRQDERMDLMDVMQEGCFPSYFRRRPRHFESEPARVHWVAGQLSVQITFSVVSFVKETVSEFSDHCQQHFL